MSILAFEGVHYSYPDETVGLDDITFSIERGERVAVIGPNGAGKTTLMLHLNGLLRASEGRVIVDGIEVTKKNLSRVRQRVGLVFQDPDDQLFMPTVAADVAFGPANYGLKGAELDERVRRALDQVEIGDLAERAPHNLSGGQRQRVALATVLAMEPEILVLDEPSSALDPRSRRLFAELVLGLDLTTVLVTHDLGYARVLCERAVVMDHSQLVGDGPIDDILSDREFLAGHRLE